MQKNPPPSKSHELTAAKSLETKDPEPTTSLQEGSETPSNCDRNNEDRILKSDDEEETVVDNSDDSEVSQKSGARSALSKHTAPFGKVIEILFTALVAALLTVGTTFYLQRNTAPQLFIDYSWCRTSMHPYKLNTQIEPKGTNEDTYVSFVVDLKTQSLVPYNSYLISLKYDKKNSYTYTPDLIGYIGRMVVENSGKTTATSIRIGVAYPFPAVFEIRVAPNVKATLVPFDPKQVAKDNSYWPYRNEIQIEDLAPGQKAFITLSWSITPADKNLRGESHEIAMYYVPEIIYFSSREVLGRVRSFVPYKSLVETQDSAMSETMPPFYHTPLDVHKPVQLKAELLSEERARQILQFQWKSPAPDNPSAPPGLR